MQENWIICPIGTGLEITLAAVKSFYAQDCENVKILLFDNQHNWLMPDQDIAPHINHYADTNGKELHWLVRRGSSVSQCWNRSLDLVFRLSDHALVCNNDVELRPEGYRLLLEHGGDFVTFQGWGDRDAVFSAELHPEQTDRHPNFCAFLIRKSAWDKTGRFDERFEPAYYEDNDYHIRLHQAGVLAESIGVPVYHLTNGSQKYYPPEISGQIRAGGNVNRGRFAEKWHCYPGDDRYNAYFAEKGPHDAV